MRADDGRGDATHAMIAREAIWPYRLDLHFPGTLLAHKHQVAGLEYEAQILSGQPRSPQVAPHHPHVCALQPRRHLLEVALPEDHLLGQRRVGEGDELLQRSGPQDSVDWELWGLLVYEEVRGHRGGGRRKQSNSSRDILQKLPPMPLWAGC